MAESTEQSNGRTPKKDAAPGKANGNGVKADEDTNAPAQKLDPSVLEKVAQLRTRIHETFGKATLAMMALPRYRHLSLIDLNHVLLEPLLRDRVAIASSPKGEGEAMPADTLSGIAIWASVSEAVDAKIREQIKAGVFPVRLAADEWASGDINWLFDVIAPNERLTTSVIANFRQVVKEGDLRIHPLITRLVDPETLKKMGAAPVGKGQRAEETETTD